MDFFDERVLTALKDGKPKDFASLLSEVGFSHNTLQQHLNRLTAKGLVVREKVAGSSFGRPKFTYHVPSKTAKQLSAAMINPQVELVTVAFSRFKRICARNGRISLSCFSVNLLCAWMPSAAKCSSGYYNHLWSRLVHFVAKSLNYRIMSFLIVHRNIR